MKLTIILKIICGKVLKTFQYWYPMSLQMVWEPFAETFGWSLNWGLKRLFFKLSAAKVAVPFGFRCLNENDLRDPVNGVDGGGCCVTPERTRLWTSREKLSGTIGGGDNGSLWAVAVRVSVVLFESSRILQVSAINPMPKRMNCIKFRY